MTEREEFEATLVELSQRDEETFDKPFLSDDINVLWAIWQAARRTTPDREAIIEQCAKVCDAAASRRWYGEDKASEGCDFCAEEIRALKAAPNGGKGEGS